MSPSDRTSSSHWVLGTILVLGIALAARLFALTGDMLYDPIVYAQNAHNLLQGTFTLETTSWFAHRLTVFVPVAPLYALFGVGAVTSRIWPLFLSLAQIGLLIAFGRRLLGPTATWVAALLVALAPLDAAYSVVLNPDIVIATFMTATLVFWYLALERGPGSAAPAAGTGASTGADTRSRRDGEDAAISDPDRGGRAGWFLFVAGAMLALAGVTRLFAVVLLVPLAVHWLWVRPGLRATATFAAGVLVVALPLAGIYWIETGDPLYRLGVVTGRYGEGAKSEGAQLLYYPRLLWHVRYTLTGVVPALFLVGILGALVRPTRTRVLLLLWAVPILLYLQFGTMSLSEYIPILKRDRFLLPLSVPLALLAGSVGVGLADWIGGVFGPNRRRIVARVLLGLGILVVAASSFDILSRRRAEGVATHRAFADTVEVLRGDPDTPVLFDHWRTGYRFSYYFGFEEGADFYRGGDDALRMGSPGSFGDSRLGYLTWYPDPAGLPDAFVVLDQRVLEAVRLGDSVTQTYRTGEIPPYAYDPPASWDELARHGSFVVYRTHGG